jgi:hypothetical protein
MGERSGRMNLWELIKKGAEDGLEAMKDSLTVFMSEAGRTSRILKKRVELTSVQGNVRKAFILLGSRAYDLHSGKEKNIYENEEIKGMIGQIDGYKTRVREIEAEIETIRIEEEQQRAAREKSTPVNRKK